MAEKNHLLEDGNVLGTTIVSPIVPNAGQLDKYSTHYSHFGHGGYRTLDTISQLNYIPWGRRELGMTVFVVQSRSTYRLKKQWKEGDDWDRYYINGQKVEDPEVSLTLEQKNQNLTINCWQLLPTPKTLNYDLELGCYLVYE